MLSINTNYSSINAQRIQAENSGLRDSAAEKLTSGLRLNRSADDAAGLTVLTNMNTHLMSGHKVVEGLAHGIDYIKVADGGLVEVLDMLQRSRELALQAVTGTLNDQNRTQLNEEFVNLKSELDRVARTTEFNGIFPFAYDIPPVISDILTNGAPMERFTSGTVSFATIPQGSTNVVFNINSFSANDDINIFTTSGRHVAGPGPLNAADQASILTYINGFDINASYDASNLNDGGGFSYPATNTTSLGGSTVRYSGNGNPTNNREQFTIDSVPETLLVFVKGVGQFNAQATWDSMPPPEETVVKLLGEFTPSGESSYITVDKTPVDQDSLNLTTSSIDTQANAELALVSVTNALEQVTNYRASYGAKQNSVESQFNMLQVSIENLYGSVSQIGDADMARQSTKLAKQSILQSASSNVLVQAHQNPQMVMRLVTDLNQAA